MIGKILAAAVCLHGTLLFGASLELNGILGNSGEPDNPIRFTESKNLRNIALGVVYDAERGLLYERAGRGLLNAYTLDGRLAATYPISREGNHLDMMVRCNDDLVMMIQEKLYRLRIGSSAGTAPTLIATDLQKMTGISSSAWKGKLAVMTKPGKIFLLDPLTGKNEEFCDFGREAYGSYMDFDDQGEFIMTFDRFIYKFADGKVLRNELWPRRFIGTRESGAERLRFLDGFWYGGAWHGTVKRFDREFEPAPGVILGGGSGHFIGYVTANFDADNPRGIALVRPGVFAIGGMGGVVQLAEYQPELKRLHILRRIGALTDGRTLAIDTQGRVLVKQFIWNASADSQSPADFSVSFEGSGPVAYFDADTMLFIATQYNQPRLGFGKLVEQQLYHCDGAKVKLPPNPVGIALFRGKPDGSGDWRMLTLGESGAATLNEVAPDRNTWRKEIGDTRLETAQPTKRYTALAGAGNNRMYAAADGSVIEFTREGDSWKEARRFGPYGTTLKLAFSAGLLALADQETGRVAILDADGKILCETKADAPSNIAFNGGVLVVYELKNQRVLRFAFTR